MYSSAFIWAKIISYLEDHLTAATTSSFFDDTEVIELNDEQLILYSPSEFRRDTIRRRFAAFIQDALKDLLGGRSFAQINKSVIVNINCVKSIQAEFSGNYRIKLKNRKESLTISRKYFKEFKDRI